MEYVHLLIAFGQIFTGVNVRLPNRMNLDGLTSDIEHRGLIEPITVWEKDDGYEVVRGHRRHAAIARLTPDAFQKHFGDGVPCLVVSGVTEAEIAELKVDHGSELALSDPHEAQLCANLLFRSGATENDVSINLSTLLDRVSPMKATSRKKMEEITSANERQEFYFQYRRGMVQHMHNVYRSPSQVGAALYYKACEIKPEGFEETYLPILTNAQVASLWKAYKEDLEIKENGVVKYNKRQPGPSFLKKWDKIVADQQKEKETGVKEKKAKAMSAKAIKEMAADFLSNGFRQLAAMHAGESGIDLVAIKDADSLVYFVELVQENDPSILDDLLTAAQDIETKIKAEAKAAQGEESAA